MSRRCSGSKKVGGFVAMAMMFSFAAGMDAMRAIAFYKGQRPNADSGDAAMDISLSVIFLFSAAMWGYRIADNHFVHPEQSQ